MLLLERGPGLTLPLAEVLVVQARLDLDGQAAILGQRITRRDAVRRRRREDRIDRNARQEPQDRDRVLQFLYLARGAARYESDPMVAVDFIDKAKLAAAAAQEDLAAIAIAAGIELGSSGTGVR